MGIEKLGFRMWAAVMSRPALYRRAADMASLAAPRDSEWLKPSALLSIGPLKAWMSQRDLPVPAPKTFRQMWRERQ
jgi:hypothetical protein